MAIFKYKALSSAGTPIEGLTEGRDKFDALSKIKQQCPVVESIEPVSGKGFNISIGNSIRIKDLALMSSQFSIILSSGLPLVQAVELVGEQSSSRRIRELLKDVRDDVGAGYSLAASFAKRGPELPTTFVETLRTGEESGNLEQSFARLSTYYFKRSKTSQKVSSAMIYPAFVLIVAVIVIYVIMTYAMPTFTSMFASSGTELPALTRGMIAISDFFVHHNLTILAVAAAIFAVFKLYSKTENGKLNFSLLSLRLPVIGKIVQLSGASQFAATMGTMLGSGLQVVPALEVSCKALNNYAMSCEIRSVIASVESGKRLSTCLGRTKHLPKMLIEMVSVGEETGSLENTLDVISQYYDNEVDVSTSKALSLLEPLIIVILAVFVVLLLLAVYVPMFSMYDGLYV